MNRFGGATLVLLAAACAGPRVETAAVEPVVAPTDWRTQVAAQAPLEAQWWRGFGDPQLVAMVERALERNPDIAIAVGRVREARAAELNARAALLPTLDASGGVSQARTVNAFGLPSESTSGQPQIQAAWEIDLFGRLADTRAAARAQWIASQAARDAVRLSVASTAASGYLTLLALDARLNVARETLAARSDSLRLIRRRVEEGYSPKLELEQAEADYQAAAKLVPAAQESITRQENALRLLTGDLPGPVARGASLATLVTAPIPEGLPSQLLARRPDVVQAEETLVATDRSLSAVRKRFLPTVRLTGAAGAVVSSLLGDPITIWSVGGSVLAPLFEGGRLRAGAEGAAAQRDQAAESYRRTALTAFREVDDALSGVVSADEQLRIGTAQRAALAESYRLARNRYRAGYSPFLEELDAQRGLLSAELALVQTRADALTARVTLYRALGGGWTGEALER
ncbi:efflux transporter outer membrane subunit [Novosphingobium sp. 9U]|uniref:efflux transporter outer membrane subunit n=1 Tax=Novosphingobium sp. 9U TaxID=2653158 RepID=UPI0012F3317B|nr:efflux transporter outer membrane subunit [Novosphingobium sp. 9U]VWX47345.1 RND transporter [Novosphingobium sp. 9U]